MMQISYTYKNDAIFENSQSKEVS